MRRRRAGAIERWVLTNCKVDGSEEAEAGGTELKFDAGRGRVDFAVRVQQAGSGSLDDEARSSQVEHLGRADQGATKESRDERKGVQKSDGRDGGEVEQTVVDTGAGSNVGVVAVLVRVADGERERPESRPFPVVFDPARLWFVGLESGSGGGEVTQKSPALEAIEARGDFGLKAEARDREKRVTVGEARVDEAGLAAEENRECACEGAVDAEVAAEAVTGAARNEAEGRGRAGEDGGDFVEGAVAADGDDESKALVEGARGEFGGVTRSLGQADAGIVRGGESTHGVDHAMSATGEGIENEESFQAEIFFDRS